MTAQAGATAPAVNSQGSCVVEAQSGLGQGSDRGAGALSRNARAGAENHQASAGLALVTSNGGSGSRQ